jgi:cation diffusion facilitator CzcD-associated flavoprotein CzcO
MGNRATVDAIVVGAGLAGLYALYRLRAAGLSVQGFEAGAGVGGTWYWNRYPGARCDVESVDYSYSFSEELQQEWEWTERYAAQPEILAYIRHVARRFDLERHVRFSTRVTAARYDQASHRWRVRTDAGESYSARFCVMAAGCLSLLNVPAFPGLELFRGAWYHTARWPHARVDLAGKRVGVIGTGSTGIQIIPEVAEHARHLYVFQRTPNFSMPARNRALARSELQPIKATYAARREKSRWSDGGFPLDPPRKSALQVSDEERHRTYEAGWQEGGALALLKNYNDLLTNADANATAAAFARSKIRATVHDPEVAETLLPRDHPMGSKRPCADTNYYETFNADHVTLVDVRSTPIESITAAGLRTSVAHYDLDALIFATGFDAITGALLDIELQGRGGRRLRDAWAAGARTYLGIATHGFPNLFMVNGPGSPSVLTNMVYAIEQHVEWITDCIEFVVENRLDAIEASQLAQDGWVAHSNEVASKTLRPAADSWYLGANVPGKPRIYLPYAGGLGNYRRICDEIARSRYEGFTVTPHRTVGGG